jgi:acyl carrier protein
MDITSFISHFSDVFEDVNISKITPETKFREFPEWSSLLALSFIAMVDDVYQVKVTGLEIREAITFQDLFNLVKSKK